VNTSVAELPIPAQPDLKRQPAPTVVTTTQQVTINPKPISRTPPTFPPRAEDRQIEGYVDFDFTIEPNGTVGDPRVVEEVPTGFGFAAAAQKVFPSWKFQAKEVNGQAVASPARIRISFKLSK
jgi:protein TonB